MPAKRVLSVGQCWADHGALEHLLERQFQAKLVNAATAADAVEQLRQVAFDLVLVNRVFDADGGSGVELIKQVKADSELAAVPVMMVSNYEDAQREAQAAGAVPGFGKAALGHPQTAARLRPYLG
jgi:CheY-like chemotaxis protein